MARAISELACPDPDDIAAFLSARLDPSSVRALEAHVCRCAACRELLSALASTNAAAVSAVGPRDAESLAPTMPLIGGAPLPELASGARVGRYVVIERLGEGGMGVVYAAHDPELHRKVALKLLRGDGAGPGLQEPWHARLRREAQAMAQLAHPNVVMVHDVGRFGDRIFIAMELVEGETLARWLASAPRPRRDVLATFRQAGQGLVAAHAAGLVHRDFKPENVLATLVTHGLAGCESAVEIGPPVATPTTLRATTVVDDLEVEVVLTLDERGTRLAGTRTARAADGTVQVEDVALDVDLAGAGVGRDGTGAFPVPGVDGLTLDVAHAESHPGGATYVLTSSQGHEIVVEVEGDAGYVIWAAVGLIASVGGLAILATCGFLVYTAIKSCANQNKCWQYKLTRGFCAGACRNC